MDAFLSSMSAKQMAEWEWFFQLEPFGSEVDELRLAQIAAVLATINTTKSFSPDDFRLFTKAKPQPEQSVEEMFETLKGIFGGTIS